MTGLVTAILPVYNRARWIARSVDAVLAQTYTPLELLVVDDGSTDETPAVLARYGSRLTVIRQPRGGAYAARNAALRQARGDLFAFADSDDAWLPDRLSRQVPLFARPEVGLVFGDAVHVVGDEVTRRPLGRTSFQVTPPRRGRVAGHFAWGNFVPTSTVLVRRRSFERCGPFPVGEPLSADYLKWFQIALDDELDFVPAPVVEYTIHPGGISQDLGESLRARIRLFSDELGRTSAATGHDAVRRLLFNLALHLGWAGMRGRARPAMSAVSLAGRTAVRAAGVAAPVWAAAFAWHHARLRSRRLRAMRPLTG